MSGNILGSYSAIIYGSAECFGGGEALEKCLGSLVEELAEQC